MTATPVIRVGTVRSRVLQVNGEREAVVHIGSSGFAGSGADTEEFTQSTPSSVWTVNHSLAYRPNVAVLDDAGVEIQPRVEHVTASQILVTHSTARTGSVLLS